VRLLPLPRIAADDEGSSSEKGGAGGEERRGEEKGGMGRSIGGGPVFREVRFGYVCRGEEGKEGKARREVGRW